MDNRSKKLLGLCSSSTRARFHSIVKVLELDRFHLLPSGEVKFTQDKHLRTIILNKKQYHVLVVLTGDLSSMKKHLEQLIIYERVAKKYKHLSQVTVSTQTETSEPSNIYITSYGTETVASLESLTEPVAVISAETEGNGVMEDTDENLMQDPTIIELNQHNHQLQSPIVYSFETEGEDMDGNVMLDPIIIELDQRNNHPQPSIIVISAETEGKEVIEDSDKNLAQHPIINELDQNHQPQLSIDKPARDPSERKSFCIFCKSAQTNLNRHLSTKHKDEVQVSEALKMASKEKRRAFVNMKRKGDIEMYGACTARKGAKSVYVECSNCGASFSKNNLYKHYKVCSGQKAPKNLKTIAHHSKQIKHVQIMSDPLKTIVLPGMACSQELFEAITIDKHIIDFGNSQCLRFGTDIVKQKNLTRLKLRNLGKVRLGVSRLDPNVTSIIDVFSPKQWDNLMSVIVDLSHLSSDKSKQAPTTVRHLGLLLSNVAKDIKAGLPPKAEERIEIKAWIEKFERSYQNTIGWQANKAAVKKKWENRKLQPLANDIFKLNQYNKENMLKSVKTLKIKYDEAAFDTLSKACMTHTVTFNRKRIGEVTDITVEDYKRKEHVQENSDIFLGLSESEKLYAKRYFHLDIRGKLGRPVPLLISEQLAEAVDLLLKFRTNAGVDKQNQYLFAKKGMAHYSANIVLREAAHECGAENPEDLTSTRLRKHVATVSQTLNLTEADLRVLCGYLGHTTKTHIENYRLPSDAVHALKISRLLSALDKGKVHLFRGKKIDEIDIDFNCEEESEWELDEPKESELNEPKENSAKKTIKKKETAKKANTEKKTETANKTEIDINSIACSSKRNSTPEKDSLETYDSIELTPTPKKKINKWITPERKAMKRHFSLHIASQTLPTPRECATARSKEEALKKRKIHIMKAWVNNQIKKRKQNRDDEGDD